MQEIIHVIDDDEKLLAMIKADLETLADNHLIDENEAKENNLSQEEIDAHNELYALYRRYSHNPEKFLSMLC